MLLNDPNVMGSLISGLFTQYVRTESAESVAALREHLNELANTTSRNTDDL